MIFNLESGETVNNKFLPISRADMEERGWDELDFIVVTADAYVDHQLEVDRRLYEIRKAKTWVLS